MNTIVGWITDKSEKVYFKEFQSENFKDSLERSLQSHIESAKKHPLLYSFLDLESVEIIIKKL